ncbi:rhomboid family intramembrane serine protease [Flammeovirga kamogawensis]|uniref:Rhomboid family intramembrane serine protease n=1 Tax=Flammeovirga kamogawensis TaxID=373891 RepID=A0ABX8GS62_9BACT|nr:rhomboid family intramembrane serine protease [Flammeovirga kamogawensis]MBB6461354.1 membrane associated rhomboid family serine protease [Flammeovirga kamogawensis]QWG06259.1 rhomboid family intramembrane serine protease [Flammeovirga kamogawensis]TRX68089.1 rhomboid family intramembrane serine protease [Flammeovirga kamogawensis]
MNLTIILIAINVGISYYAWQNPNILDKLMMQPYMVQKKNEWYRFITSAFVHGSWMHLLFNMFTLYFFGRNIEMWFLYLLKDPILASVAYFSLFIIGAIVADIPTYLKQRNNINYRSLGASGGVSSIIFASIIYSPVNDICLYGILCFPGFIWGAIYLIYTQYQTKNLDSNINHSAHLYGAIFGIVYAIAIEPSAFSNFVNQVLSWRF